MPDSSTRTARAKASWSACSPRIVWHLLAVCLAAVLPFLALTVFLSYRLVAHETEDAQEGVQRSVEVTVNSIERFVQGLRSLLHGLSQRELTAALDPRHCDPALVAILRLNPEYTNVFTVDTSGKRMCSAVPLRPHVSDQVDPALYLDAVRATRKVVLSPPVLGVVTGKWTVYAAAPILHEGALAGVVAVGIDLRALTKLLDPRTLPMGGVVTVVGRDDIVVTRHPHAQAWIGRPIGDSPPLRAARRGETGTLRAAGLDGVDRIWSSQAVRGSDWLVLAGVSSQATLEAPQALRTWIIAVGGVITLVSILLSLALARRIREPIEAMAAAAPRLGVEGAAPLVPAGPAEAVTLATELNRGHAQHLAMERRLRDERARLEGLVTSAMDAMITVDAEHRIVVFNAAAEKMFGVPASSALGGSLDRFVPARFRAGHGAHVRKFERAGTTSRQMGHLGTVWGVRANGEEFPIEAAISQVEVGGRPFLTAIVRDITERVRADLEVRALAAGLEMRVEERTAELEAANKELQAFDYSISHDLRAPVNRIAGFAAALREDPGSRLGSAGLGYLQRIEATAAEMARLVGDMLELSTLTRRDIDRTEVDLGALAQSIVATLRMQSARDVAVTVQPGLVAHADPGLTRIVLENLIGNAWKFTARRAGARIEVGSKDIDAGKSAFFVRDNGAGFDPVAAAKLFQPFRRLHSKAEFPGSGVGLATVERIVRRHGGRVWAQGAVESGATFHFTLEP